MTWHSCRVIFFFYTLNSVHISSYFFAQLHQAFITYNTNSVLEAACRSLLALIEYKNPKAYQLMRCLGSMSLEALPMVLVEKIWKFLYEVHGISL
jgi:hypothetical protein